MIFSTSYMVLCEVSVVVVVVVVIVVVVVVVVMDVVALATLRAELTLLQY